MRRLFVLSLSALPALLSCVTAPPAPAPTARLDVLVSAAQAEPMAAPSADDASAAGGELVDPAARAEALAKVKDSPTKVILEAGPVFHECSGAGGVHAYFSVPAAWGDQPFEAAVLGGHGVWGIPEEPGRLYVAGVRLRARYEPPPNPGWCLDSLPASDADVVALVPVRSFAEGLRMLEKIR